MEQHKHDNSYKVCIRESWVQFLTLPRTGLLEFQQVTLLFSTSK